MAQRGGGHGGGGGARGGGGGSIGHSGGVSGGVGRVGGYSGVGRVGGGVSSVGIGAYGGLSGYRGTVGYPGYRTGFYRATMATAGFTVMAASTGRMRTVLGITTIPTIRIMAITRTVPIMDTAIRPPISAQRDDGYPQQQPSAPVSVYTASPVMRRYRPIWPGDCAAGFGNSRRRFVSAVSDRFKDHTIVPAMSYSVTGDTFDYVTLDREAKHVPLASVDRDLSRQLNRERRVAFNLPGQ